MARTWHYESGSKVFGPISSDQLRILVSSGIVTPETMVLMDSQKEWFQAGRITGLWHGEIGTRSSSMSPLSPPPLPPGIDQQLETGPSIVPASRPRQANEDQSPNVGRVVVGVLLSVCGILQAIVGYGLAVFAVIAFASAQIELEENPFAGLAGWMMEGNTQRWVIVGSFGVLIAVAGWFVSKK